MGFVPAKCPADCVYRTVIHGSTVMCGYLHMTGELRGCDPGKGCKRYIGKHTQYMDFKRRAPIWDVELGRKMWAEGYSDSQIGKKLGVARETVARYRQRNWGEINRQRKRRKPDGKGENDREL